MLLAIDIGNTTINNGIFEGRILKRSFRIPTYKKDLRDSYRAILKKIDRVVIVSVVPEVLGRVEKIFGKSAEIVGKNIATDVRNKYKRPGQVGQDRLVNAMAAYELYGGANIIVDFGTAITIDVINHRREYLGGVIVPGVEISLDALSSKAAMLPKIKLDRPKGILGKETRESMISGAIYGFASLCDGIVERLKKRHSKKARIIATGGLSRLIGPYCETVDEIDPELTLKGLMLIGS